MHGLFPAFILPKEAWQSSFSDRWCLFAYLNRGGAGRLICSTRVCQALCDCFKHLSKGDQHLEILELSSPLKKEKKVFMIGRIKMKPVHFMLLLFFSFP